MDHGIRTNRIPCIGLALEGCCARLLGQALTSGRLYHLMQAALGLADSPLIGHSYRPAIYI